MDLKINALAIGAGIVFILIAVLLTSVKIIEAVLEKDGDLAIVIGDSRLGLHGHRDRPCGAGRMGSASAGV